MVENNGVYYVDDTPLSQSDIDQVNRLVDQGDYSTAGKIISNFLKTKKYGKPTRGALSLWAENMGNTAGKSNDTANEAKTIAEDTQERFKLQIEGQDYDNESKDARYSAADDKTYDVLTDRLNAMDKKPQQAVDNLEVGSANLLRNSNVQHNTATYEIDEYVLSEKMIEGQTYTAVIKGQLAEGKTSFTIYLNGGTTVLAGLSKVDNDLYSATFIGKADSSTAVDYIALYQMPQGVEASSVVEWILLKKGSKGLDWSPNFADQERHAALGKGVLFLAHRGASYLAPENSLQAFIKEGNHDGIEADVHLTSDGQWIVMHDDTVDRMTNGSGAISSYTLNDLRKLRIDNGTDVIQYEDRWLVIPTLAEFLTICKDHNMIPEVEVKVSGTNHYDNSSWDSLAALIKQFDFEKNMIISCSGFSVLQNMRKRLPYTELCLNCNDITQEEIEQMMSLAPNVMLGPNQNSPTLTSKQVQYCHEKGIKIGIGTPSDDNNRNALISLGVDSITNTNASGRKLYAKLIPLNGWTQSDPSYLRESYVQQSKPGTCQVEFNIGTGEKTDGTKIFSLPDWASPNRTSWKFAMFRTKDGVGFGQIEIGPAGIKIGKSFETANTSWVTGSFTYNV